MSGPWFEEWVEKAEEDYKAASALDADTVSSVVCFHCQQCTEKYLKAALVKHGLAPQRTHNLTVLNNIVSGQDRRFERFYDELAILSPYSVAGRYPGVKTAPEDARQALKVASELRSRIRRLLNLQAEP